MVSGQSSIWPIRFGILSSIWPADSGVNAHPRGHPRGLMLLSPFHSMLSKLQALQAGDCPGGTDTAVSQPGAYLNKQHQGWEAPENPRRQEWLSPNVICPQPPEAYASVSCRWSSSPTLSVSEAKL